MLLNWLYDAGLTRVQKVTRGRRVGLKLGLGSELCRNGLHQGLYYYYFSHFRRFLSQVDVSKHIEPNLTAQNQCWLYAVFVHILLQSVYPP